MAIMLAGFPENALSMRVPAMAETFTKASAALVRAALSTQVKRQQSAPALGLGLFLY